MSATRNSFDQPGANDSVYNTPIGSGAIWSRDTDPDTISLRSKGARFNYGPSGINVFVGTSLDPIWQFIGPTSGFYLRFPLSATDLISNNNIYCFDKTKPFYMYAFLGCSTPRISSTGRIVNFTSGECVSAIDSLCPANNGSLGLCAQVGVVRSWEVNQLINPSGRIQHTLHYYADSSILTHTGSLTQNVPWPNSRIDTNNNYSGNLQAGATIGIPADVEMPSGLTVGGQMLWRCLQEFGAIWRGTSKDGGISFTGDRSGTNILEKNMNTDASTIINYCCVLRNQFYTSKNGGGTPLSVSPPPLFSIMQNSNNTGTSILIKTIQINDSSIPGQLSTGPFTTKGCQIIDGTGTPQRIHSVGWDGGVSRHWILDGTDAVGTGYQDIMNNMVNLGFNCIRLSTCARAVLNWDTPIGSSTTCLQVYDNIIDYASQIGLRIIIDSNNSDGSNNGNLGTQPINGMWYDLGGANGNNMSDGQLGQVATVQDSDFYTMWQILAYRWRKKPAILGYDIQQEPQAVGHAIPGCTWAGYNNGIVGSNQDIRAMYERIGNLIQSIDPNPLIICEALIDWPNGAYSGDLRAVLNYPVRLNNRFKVVYSVHEYPQYSPVYTGESYINLMNTMWGFLISKNLVPMLVGCGGSLSSQREVEWASTFIPYVNGMAPNGPNFSQTQQGISTNWEFWTNTGDFQSINSFTNSQFIVGNAVAIQSLAPFNL